MPTPNKQFRAARTATPSPVADDAALSRAELAELVNAWLGEHTTRHGNVDEKYVSKIEQGRVRWPNKDYRAAFRAVLGASADQQLGFAPVKRRPLSTLTEFDPPRALQADRAGVVPDVTADVTAIGAMSEALQVADRKVGGGVLYDQVLRYLQSEIAPRLLAADGASQPLFAAAASLTEIAGWMAHDAGRDDPARQHLERAYRLALAAGDDALVGNVCASMSHLAGQLAQPTDAVRIAEAGLQRARSQPGTLPLTARLHAMRARALAMLGDGAACRAALSEAESTLASTDAEPPAEWLARFDDGALAGEAALCFRQLGDLSEAERQAREVIRLRPTDRVRSRAFGQLTLARVLLDAGRVDEAADVGREVCAAATTLTSARVQSRLERFAEAMTEHRDSPSAAAFLAAVPRAKPATVVTSATWPV